MKRTKQISTLPSFFNTRQAFRDTVKSKRNLSTQSHFNTLSNFSGSSNYKHGMTPSAVSFLSQPFKTNLTEKDSEYLSTIYTNISDYKGISSKYNITYNFFVSGSVTISNRNSPHSPFAFIKLLS